jgi:hypothetical protein
MSENAGIPDLVSQFESQKQSSASDLVAQHEAVQLARRQHSVVPDLVVRHEGRPVNKQTSASDNADEFIKEMWKMHPARAGAPHDPQIDQPWKVDARSGREHQDPLVPEQEELPLLDAWVGLEPIATGLSRIRENVELEPIPGVFHTNPKTGIRTQAMRVPERNRRQIVLGAAESLEGAGKLGEVALPAAFIDAPFSTLLEVGSSKVAEHVAGEVSHKMGVNPETERLIRSAAPLMAAGLVKSAGFKETAQGTPSEGFAGFTALGKAIDKSTGRTVPRVAGVIARSDRGTGAGLKVGDVTMTFKFPRAPKKAVSATDPGLDEAVAAMIRYEEQHGSLSPSVPVKTVPPHGTGELPAQLSPLEYIGSANPPLHRGQLTDRRSVHYPLQLPNNFWKK